MGVGLSSLLSIHLWATLYIKNIVTVSLSATFLWHQLTDFDKTWHEQRSTEVVVPNVARFRKICLVREFFDIHIIRFIETFEDFRRF